MATNPDGLAHPYVDTAHRAALLREGDEPPGLHPYMWALIVVEIAGFSVLLAGFVSEQIL